MSWDVDIYDTETGVDGPVDVWDETIGLEDLVLLKRQGGGGILTTKALWARTSLL
jgi:hypothetical protein